jgi:hypothetical protein
MLVGEIIQRVQSLYSKGASSQSSRLMNRHVYAKMLTVRALLIYNKINKRQFISKWNYTTLGCLELIPVDENDCPCSPIPGCQILRTKYKLPKPVNSINGYIIDGVTSINGQIIFAEVTYKSKNWRASDKYTSKKPDYFIKDDYLYITSTRTLKAITVIALFADPTEAENHPTKCSEAEEESCPIYPMDIDFPIDDEMIDALVELTLQEIVVGFPLGNEDRRNEGQDKVETQQNSGRQSQRTQQPQQRRSRNE